VRRMFVALAFLATAGCGYHAGSHSTILPATVKTVAVPAFGNVTPNYRLPALLTADVTRELIARTKFNVVASADQADATLTGTLVNFISNPRVVEPKSGRSTGVEAIVVVNLRLTDKHTGKVLYNRQSQEFRERYEIAIDPQQYFDESGPALQRLSKDVARSVVTAILEAF
jgi:hypothetical protein